MHRSFRSLAVAAALALAASSAVAGDSIHSDDFDASDAPIACGHTHDAPEGFRIDNTAAARGDDAHYIERHGISYVLIGRNDPLVTYSPNGRTVAQRATCSDYRSINQDPNAPRTAVACGRAIGIVTDRF